MGGVDIEYSKLVETQLLWLLGTIDTTFFDQLSSTPGLRTVSAYPPPLAPTPTPYSNPYPHPTPP